MGGRASRPRRAEAVLFRGARLSGTLRPTRDATKLEVGRAVPGEPKRRCFATLGSAGRFALPATPPNWRWGKPSPASRSGAVSRRSAQRDASPYPRRHQIGGGASRPRRAEAALFRDARLSGTLRPTRDAALIQWQWGRREGARFMETLQIRP